MSKSALSRTASRRADKQQDETLGKPLSVPSNRSTDDVIEELFARQAVGLRRYLQRLLGTGPPDPDDVIQEAFERIAKSGALNQVDSPAALLWRTAQNIVMSAHRASEVRTRHAATVEQVFYPEKSGGFDPERVLIAKAELSRVMAAINSMSEKQRTVLLMSRMDGLSLAEIARRLGLARSTVSKRLSLALVELDKVTTP